MIFNGIFILYLIINVLSEKNKELVVYKKRTRKVKLNNIYNDHYYKNDYNNLVSQKMTNDLFNDINKIKNINQKPKNKYYYQYPDNYNYKKKHNSYNNKYLRGTNY